MNLMIKAQEMYQVGLFSLRKKTATLLEKNEKIRRHLR